MEFVFPCGICLGVIKIGDGLNCPCWIIIIMEKRVVKYNVINYRVICVENSLKGLLNHCWYFMMIVLLWIVQCYENGNLLNICTDMSFALFWYMIVTSVIWIEKEQVIKEDVPFWGTYRSPWFIIYFDVCITRRDGYYIYQWIYSCTAIDIIIKWRVMHCGRCTDKYVPHRSQTERQQVCLIRSDMHHYTWHCIALFVIGKLDLVCY